MFAFPLTCFSARLGKRAIRVDSPAFFSYVAPTFTYKLCKEPRKAQLKKTFPILSFYHTFQPVRYIVILSEPLSRPNNIGILAIHSHSRPGALTLS
jgi:hypothetical protein